MNMQRGGQQRAVSMTFPAPMSGINATSPAGGMPLDECLYCYNILPEDFGMEVRDGFVEWANGWIGSVAKTVMPFEGNVETEDRLYVCNNEGIWDCTAEGETTPTQVVTFPSSAGQAGVCSSVNYGNDAGDRFLLVCDGENGYYVWTQSTDTWDKIAMGGGGITGADPGLFNFIMIWKARVWFIQRDTGIAFFLSQVEGFLGAAITFNFGDQFRFGGPLVSLHNWTLDGGNGIDDYLVGISGSGDVIVYQGTDPTSRSDFGLVGSWYVGELPFGNRVASEFSGELYILSVQGLLPMSDLLNGSTIGQPQSYITKKVSPYIRSVMDNVEGDFGWHVHIHPKQSLLYVNTPPEAGKEQLAFTMYFGTNAWGIIRGLTKNHTANWRGEVYWVDNRVNKLFVQRGFVDNVFLDPIVDGDPLAIRWALLTAYTPLDEPARFKRVQYIRPLFIGGGEPAYKVQAEYDFSLTEVGPPPALIPTASGLWADGGDYMYALKCTDADVLYLSFTDGTKQVAGVTTIDVTIGTEPLVTLTFSVPNERYEALAVDMFDYLLSEVANPLATTLAPDIIASGSYTLTPAVIGADVGFEVPSIMPAPALPPSTTPVSTANGLLTPGFLFDTNTVGNNDGIWNVTQWTGPNTLTDTPRGGSGLGRHVAVNISGQSSKSVTLIAFDVIYDMGGLM